MEGMTSRRYFIGILGLLLLSSISSAYTLYNNILYCGNSTMTADQICTDCTNALNNLTYNTIYLNATVSGASGTCISDPLFIMNKTFDCNSYTISGSGVGSGVDLEGVTTINATIQNCEISGFQNGIYIADNALNVTVENCTTYNNTNAGVHVLSSDYIDILHSISYNNTNYGFIIRGGSDNCYFDNDTAYDNNYGFDIQTADFTIANNSVAHDNTFYGVYIHNNANNNTVWNTYAYNNSDSGFVLQDLDATFNRIYSSNATNNTNDGFYLTDNNWTWIIDTESNLNGRDGYRLESSRWVNITNGSAFNNTGSGYSYNGGFGYIVAHSRAFDNDAYGLHAWGPTTINFLTFSDIYSNDLDGVYLEDGCNFHGLRNDSIYGNGGWGFYALNAHWHIVVNTTIYDNAGGMYLDNSDGSNYTNLIFYNNSAANLWLVDSSNCTFNGVESEFSDWGLVIEETSPAGGNEFYDVLIYNTTNHLGVVTTDNNSFTNLTLGYNKSIGLINWNFLNLNETITNFMFTNLRLRPDFVSLNDTLLPELNTSANITIYGESWYTIFKRTGFPTTYNDIIENGTVYTPLSKTWSNGILTFGVSGFSGYAAKASCFYANESDTVYNITANLVGNKSDAICITINASNVTIECNGFNVTGNYVGTTYGIRADDVENITILNCNVRNYSRAVYLSNTNHSDIIDNVAYNNTYGFWLTSSSDNDLINNVARDNANNGFRVVTGSDDNLLLNNTAYNNSNYGFSIVTSNYSKLIENVAYNNTNSGFLLGSNVFNSNLTDNEAYNNTAHGFYLSQAPNNNLTDNIAYENDQHGFYAEFSDNSMFINNHAYNNTQYGFYSLSANYSNYTTNRAYNNTLHGFYLDASYYNNLTNNFAYDNLWYGFYLNSNSGDNRFTNNEAYNNSLDGFFLNGGCDNNNFTNNRAYNNSQNGFSIYGSNTISVGDTAYLNGLSGFWFDSNASIANAVAYSNNVNGLFVRFGTFNITNVHLYNNIGEDLQYFAASGSSTTVNITNATIDNPSGTFQNYTSLVINDYDSGVAVSYYNISWNPEPATPPIGYPSFRQKYVNITGPAIDQIRWTWVDSELTGYNESKFELWEHNGTWSYVSGQTLVVASNYIEVLNFVPTSTYGILQKNISECFVISAPGSYALGNSVVGAPFNVSEVAFVNWACIKIASSNVEFDCNGYTITNNGTASAAGIVINGTLSGGYTNVTVRNCPAVSQYEYGILGRWVNDSIFDNNTAHSNDNTGFRLGYSYYNNLTNNRAYNSSKGFHLSSNADSNLLANNTVYNVSSFSFQIQSKNNRLINNTAYNSSQSGFYFNGGSDNNIVINNTAYNNAQYGFHLSSAGNNTLVDNEAYEDLYDFYLAGGSLNNNLTLNIAHDSTDGFFITGNSNYNTLDSNRAYNTSVGFRLNSNSNYNNLTNNRAYNNSGGGFAFPGSSYNIIINNTAYDTSSGEGFSLSFGSAGNTLANNTAYDNTFGFSVNSGNGNNFTNNTAYLNTHGYYIDTATNTNLTDNVARDNTNTGFLFTALSATVKNLVAYRNPRGLNLSDSVLIGADLHIYNTTVYGLSIATTGGTGYSINVTNITIDNPAGNYQNYTAFDINDSAPSGNVGYTMTWTAEPAIPPLTHFSFAQKYTDIAIVVGAPSIDLIRWTWLDSELPGYDETKFEVWEYNVAWSNVTGQTRDVANNYIEVLGFSPTSDYGILQNNNTPPSITIESPQNITYDVGTVDLNYTVSDVNLDSCWYYLDGAGPTPLLGCANTTLGPLLDGPHNVTVFVNDTLGEQNSSTVYFTTDATPPTVSIQSPNNATYDTNTVDLNYTVGDNLGVDSCWYYIDGAGPTPLPGCANTTLGPLLDGPHNITVFANDTANNTDSDTVYFTTDATPPTVTIQSPTNTTYNTTNDVDLNYTVDDNLGVAACWYYFDGAGPTLLPACDNITMTGLPNGPHNVTVFVSDIAGNENSSTVYFTVDYTPPTPPPSKGKPKPGCIDVALIPLERPSCPGDYVYFSVGATHPIAGARVVIIGPWPWSDVKYTNSTGEVAFRLPANGSYKVYVDGGKVENYCSDDYFFDYLECPDNFCYDDDDCKDIEYCRPLPDYPPPMGECVPVECECGEVYDHECHPYECCADADCLEGYVCENHECVKPECESDEDCADDEYCSDGECLKIELGECGYIENHTWYDYECCKDEDCPPGYLCFQHECNLYKIETNETGYVGDRHGVQVYPEESYRLTMTDPDGRQFTVTTDENGFATFTLEIEGNYGVALIEENESLATVSVRSLERPLPPEEEKPVVWLDELLKYFWWLLILLLLIIGYILFRRRKKKRYKPGE
jgi:parallel beta-helix repeat protein